jgi:predicted transglutaminase-like cysteine proteinase
VISSRQVAAIVLSFGLLQAAAAMTPAKAQNLADMAQAIEQSKQGNVLLGSLEIRSGSLKGLQQWVRVISAMRTLGPSFNNCAADAAACTTSVLKKWRSIVVSAKALPYEERAKAVNQFFNGWPYKLDMEVWGVREYWATPKEFMSRSGDCEDYAIAKYYALRNVGYSEDEVRIVALKDTIRGIGHAVLAVYSGNDILILDNLSMIVASHTRYKHYKPQVSMNETTRWAHVGGFEPDAAAAPAFATSGLHARTLFRKR